MKEPNLFIGYMWNKRKFKVAEVALRNTFCDLKYVGLRSHE